MSAPISNKVLPSLSAGLMIFLTSCYKEIETNPNNPKEYLGSWNNEKTTINKNTDDVYPFNKVQHYIFVINQSEITLSTSCSPGCKYQNWNVDKTTNPYTLTLYKGCPTEIPDLVFKITKAPTIGKMEITYADSIVYYLKQ